MGQAARNKLDDDDYDDEKLQIKVLVSKASKM